MEKDVSQIKPQTFLLHLLDLTEEFYTSNLLCVSHFGGSMYWFVIKGLTRKIEMHKLHRGRSLTTKSYIDQITQYDWMCSEYNLISLLFIILYHIWCTNFQGPKCNMIYWKTCCTQFTTHLILHTFLTVYYLKKQKYETFKYHLSHIIGKYVKTDIYMHFMKVVWHTVIRISLIYNLSEFHLTFWVYKYQQLHQIQYFCSVWASE